MSIPEELFFTAIDAAGQGLKSGRNRLFFDGFSEAANICTDIIDEKIEGLHNRINNGDTLSAQEQYLLAQLNSLVNELKDELFEYAKNKK